MQRSMRLCLLKHHLTKSISVFISSDAAADLPNPCIAMGADANYIVCHHPEKSHPYEKTRPIDRNDPTFAQVRSLSCKRLFLSQAMKFRERFHLTSLSRMTLYSLQMSKKISMNVTTRIKSANETFV